MNSFSSTSNVMPAFSASLTLSYVATIFGCGLGCSGQTMLELARRPGKEGFNRPLCRRSVWRSLFGDDLEPVHHDLSGSLRRENLASIVKDYGGFAIAGPLVGTFVAGDEAILSAPEPV